MDSQLLAKTLSEYLEWKRDRELYPPRWTPEDYADHLLNLDARAKVLELYKIFDGEDPDFLASNSNELTTMIEEVLYGYEREFFRTLRKIENSSAFDSTVRGYFGYNAELLLKKHRDYGPKNISGSPGGPLNGLRVRMHDKMARINHLIENDKQAVNEPLRDSFMDLANYAMIALLVIDGKWPNE